MSNDDLSLTDKLLIATETVEAGVEAYARITGAKDEFEYEPSDRLQEIADEQKKKEDTGFEDLFEEDTSHIHGHGGSGTGFEFNPEPETDVDELDELLNQSQAPQTNQTQKDLENILHGQTQVQTLQQALATAADQHPDANTSHRALPEHYLPDINKTRSVSAAAAQIIQKYTAPDLGSSNNWDQLSAALALHNYSYNELKYSTRNTSDGGRRLFKDLYETWQGGGNCEEQTVFLASLLTAVDTVKVGVVRAKNYAGGHLLPEVGVPSPPDSVANVLEELRRVENRRFPSTELVHYRQYNSDGLYWYPVDPEFSSYPGDLSSLSEKGYVTLYSNGDWEFNKGTRETVPQ